jgi:hypothetical protein
MKTSSNTNRCSPRTTTAVRTQSTAQKIDAHSIAPMVCQRLLMRVVFQNCQDVFAHCCAVFSRLFIAKRDFWKEQNYTAFILEILAPLSNKCSITLGNEAFQEVCILGERSRTSKLTNQRSAVLVLGGLNKRQLLSEPPALCKSLEPFANLVTQVANRLPPCG